MIVVDASAILEILLRTSAGTRVEKRLFEVDETLHAPHLLDLEVIRVLRRYSSGGLIDRDRGSQAIADLLDLPMDRYPHTFLLPRIWELRHNATAYDAAYLALAEALQAPLVTRDSGLASVPGHRASVEVV